MANTKNEYIVFEPDQVLTNEHLNKTFNYLDQQNRWTRNKLIGIGIACGLHLSHQTGIIGISGGCGVTSQGYLIWQPEPKQYAYIIPYSPVPLHDNFPFEYDNALPFFSPAWNNKGIFLLLTDDEYEILEPAKKAQAKTLSSQSGDFLNDYAVVLFLEANEVDLKNCDAFDCSNNGERMEFNLKPLLVKKYDVGEKVSNVREVRAEAALKSHQIRLKRYNVPYSDLKSPDAIIKAFEALVDDETLQEVSNALNDCYEQYGEMLNIDSNAFANLFQKLHGRRNKIIKEYPIFIQYFYDFIDDLIKAYYEFRVKLSDIMVRCCPDETLFPLHLILGDASKDTATYTKDSYRTYFIYSPLVNKGAAETGESLFLYRRMEMMIDDFEMLVSDEKQRNQAIKITPSQYGLPLLSERAIPYYYNVNDSSNPLYKGWNYYKTSHGNAAYNQSYHADVYSKSPAVVKPLLYDIEHYNFFRVEGHIGENYQSVLRNLLNQRQQYNLPFDVVAISAGGLSLAASEKLPECNIEDLETAYKLIVSEFACKVVTPFCYIARVPLLISLKSRKVSLNEEENGKEATSDEDTNQKLFSFFKETGVESKDNKFIYRKLLTYKKGDFMKAHCLPEEGTVGAAYVAILKEKGDFVMPVFAGTDNPTLARYYYLMFEYIDTVETVMQALMTSSMATLDMDAFKKNYIRYVQATVELAYQTGVWFDMLVKTKERPYYYKIDVSVDLLIESITLAAGSCIDERLKTLRDEYTSRLHSYALQRSFYNYYRSHPGLEHKAGVPKGGTFVIVYYEREAVEIIGRTTETDVHVKRPASTSIDGNEMMTGYMSSKEEDTSSGNAESEVVKKLGSHLPDLENVAYKDSLIQLKDVIANYEGASDESRKRMLSIVGSMLKSSSPDSRFAFTSGAVIADFYIPYLCCSDCPPVAYIFRDQPRENDDEGYIRISPRFLYDDTNNYPFDSNLPLTPDDFKDTSSNPGGLNLLMIEGKLNLHPETDIQATLETHLQYKDIKVPVTIVVPDASFTISILPDAGETEDTSATKKIQLAAKQTDATRYEWLVNGKENVFDNSATPGAVSWNELLNSDAKDVAIELTVTYVINDNTSADHKKAILTKRKIITNKKNPFELKYEKEEE